MEWKRGRDASVLQRWWAWGGMLAGVCLRSTSLCYSMRCRGKVSEEALHVGSGCEAFHLETNAFPVQWAFSPSQASVRVHVCLRKRRYTESETVSACVYVPAGSDEYRTDIGWGSVSLACIYGCRWARTTSATGNSTQQPKATYNIHSAH